MGKFWSVICVVVCIFIIGCKVESSAIKRGLRQYNRGKYDNAILNFNLALKDNPQSSAAYYCLGFTWAAKNDFVKAVESYTKAIEIDPMLKNAYIDRAYYNKKLGNYDESLADYTKIIELEPKEAKAYCARADLLCLVKKDYTSAKADYENAIASDPTYWSAYNDYAWLLATCPDEQIRNGKRAVELLQRVLRAAHESPAYLDTLAAAYAEFGDFSKAIEIQGNVISIVREKDSMENVREAEQRLENYKQSKPWREM
jgi:tetratricopeptide (TPR) repeat protein